jgi:hypothetical protein
MKSLRSLTFGLALAAFAPLALGQQIITSATLSGANENPPTASPGTGTAQVTLDTASHTLRVRVTFSGLTSNTTAAHIHCCIAAPQNTGVATTVPAFPGFPLGVTSGSLDQTYNTLDAGTWNPAFVTAHGGTPAGAEAFLASGLAQGMAYLNIHTSVNPGGEIRGFLVVQTAPVVDISNIPTMSQWGLALLAVALAAAAFLVLRRRMR